MHSCLSFDCPTTTFRSFLKMHSKCILAVYSKQNLAAQNLQSPTTKREEREHV
jgi:hypothetical protein